MEKFFDSNPGLKSRFNSFIMFENYNDEELFNILQNICDKEDYFISDNLKVEIKKHLSRETMHEKKQFSNGRYITYLKN